MAKKKKNQNQEGPVEAPGNDKVLSETGAAQGAAQVVVSANQVTIPDDVAELIRASLRLLIARRKVHGFSTTLTSLTKAIIKALDKYVDGIPSGVIRDFVKRELEAMGYKIVTAVVEYRGVKFEAETVLLYRNFDEIVEMVKSGRVESLKPVITESPDPIHDRVHA
jgi:hypothetical protein